MASQLQLLNAFDTLLEPKRFRVYIPNVLQVEGKPAVLRLISGGTPLPELVG